MNEKAFATMDADGVEIHENAEIRAFDTPEEAKVWLLSCFDAEDYDLETAVIDDGEWGDCWFKSGGPPQDGDAIKPFALDDLSVKKPGQHPGGDVYWITPYAPVLVVAKIEERG